ncbi:pyridine nucleotide-disulfide oxidoreductase [Bacteriovorax sp. BSW11_IV]|uniref:NAD(P)/FAD-dependent oxidoreductase n=1 Tax=Bacteriovorax sp. BSW11_IV TaxID=1353529 RepID=UPI000389E49B|nr:NAD(P)/FAD-dependent oxidoreductase [Bacteriovorax sp. BSW11_IV]EQC48625.1 pyridine nucleotide-disulfide oxidoreductase [Bacteriovorax sp. BSW11_IV]
MKKKFDTIIIGGGFGGLNAAIKLGQKKKEVLIIDKSNHHLFQPLLYQVATAGLSPADIATPIREILKKYPSVSVIMDEVQKINKETSTIETSSEHKFEFNNLIIATGARHSYFGNDQWESLAPGLKSLSDALKIRENILKSYELSELETDQSKIDALTTFVIVGAGPTGVEMAGAIAEIATKTLTKNFSNIDPRRSKVYLVEGGDRVLSAFHPKLSERTKKDLEKIGVTVLLKSFVKDISEEGVTIGDNFIPARNVVWAAGNKANPILKELNCELDKMGRAIVEKDCSIKGHSNIFVIGDASAFQNGNTFLPGLAPVAAQQGKYVARLIKNNTPKGKRDNFKYLDKGTMATIGKSKAVMQVGHFKMAGFFAWLSWCLIHLLFLVLFRNRVFIFFDWLYSYITEQRGARLIK